MASPIKLVRQFSGSDSQMLEFARVIHTHFTTDIADFTAFDADLDATYAGNFLTAIDNAENFSSDYQLIDALAQLSLDVEAEMTKCRKLYQGMKYFIEKAFPNRPGTWNEFGYNDYDRARKKQSEMIQFMLDLHESATKYATELDSAGFDASKVAEIQTYAQALQNANLAQEQAKGSRANLSEARIILLNSAWGMLQNIRKAAKVIYMDNWGKWQLYLLPWGGANEPPPTQPTEFTGVVGQGLTVVVAIPDLQPSTVLVLANTGPVPLRFCASIVSGADCGSDGVVVDPNDSLSIMFQDLAAQGVTPQYLNVSHTIAGQGSPDGEFEITKVS